MAYENKASYSSATEISNALETKANTSDIANFFDDAKYEDSGTTKVINFYHGNTIKATIDASDFIVDGMVDDVRIENGNLIIDFNTASGKQDISIPLTSIFDPSNYYNKTAIDNLVGSGFTSSSITDVIIENEEIVSAALTDLDERKLDASAYTPTDLSNYYTKSETSGATQISNALGAKQDILTEGRAIDITNNVVSIDLPISAGTGTNSIIEGNGTIASGDYSHAEGYITKALDLSSHAEGTNATASGFSSHAEGYSTQANGNYSHAEGDGTIASGASSHAEGSSTEAIGTNSHAEGSNTQANGSQSHAEGRGTIANNQSEHASGQYNISSSASTTFGNSGNTLFSVGNGTSSNARHNAFEIRQNGDIYITSGGTDIKLQDSLGGDIVTAITSSNSGSTNPIATKVVAENELVVSTALNDLNAALSGKSNTGHTHSISEVTNLQTTLNGKANTATTLSGYGITNAYTKTEIDNKIGNIETLLAAI